MLIEFIQGPSLENQIALINSKLLNTISEILDKYLVKKDIYSTNESNEKIFNYSQISLLTFNKHFLFHSNSIIVRTVKF